MPELRQIVTVDCPRMMARMHGPCGVHCPGLRLLINANTLKFDRADNTSPFRCEQYREHWPGHSRASLVPTEVAGAYSHWALTVSLMETAGLNQRDRKRVMEQVRTALARQHLNETVIKAMVPERALGRIAG
jgi:hypothetical protein